MIHRYLSGSDDPAFPAVLQLYHEAFDYECREPDERLVQELKGEFRLPIRFLIAEDADGLAAFARFCLFPGGEFGHLLHIATDAERRSQGLGGDLLKAVVAAIAPASLLVETSPRGRAHDWYMRHGFLTVSERYAQPSLHEDTGPVPFKLIASREVLDPEACIRTFYREAWELGDGDPLVEEACRKSG